MIPTLHHDYDYHHQQQQQQQQQPLLHFLTIRGGSNHDHNHPTNVIGFFLGCDNDNDDDDVDSVQNEKRNNHPNMINTTTTAKTNHQ
jgi:hypothetical protein